jgi:hypothetical protein
MSIKINVITDFVGDGITKARKEFAQLEGAGAKAGFAIKKAMLPATAAIGALGVALFDAAEGAIADEKAAKELARSLKATTNATDAIVESTEDWITEQGRLLGVSDDQLRPALSRLARATGDVQKAQELASQAMDISVATGKPLETVVGALEKAYGGNLTALQRLAPEYRDLIKSGASFEEVMSALAKTTGGAAAEAATTAEGRFRILKLQLDETKEAIGASLIPVIEEGLPVLERFADWAQDNPETFKNIALAIGGIAAATIGLNIAMAANPAVILAAGVVALMIAVDKLLQPLERMDNLIGSISRALGKGFFGDIGDLFGTSAKPKRSGAGTGGLGGGLMLELKGIPAMANGGIVTNGPQLALIGEAGPEAVIPLDRMGSMGGGNNVTINVQGADPNAVVDALRTYMFRNGSVPIRVA